MAVNAPFSPAAANALSAFLRGVERRALVVAELQSGDTAAATHAVGAAMRAFAGHAVDLPMAEWPARFWRLLCGTPRLREPAPGGEWPLCLQHLSGLPALERMALLLRIGAGLDEDVAAAVLAVEQAEYRHALARACPLDPGGQPDAAAWRALAEQVQARVRELPVEDLRQLEQLRESALAPTPTVKTVPAGKKAPPPARPASRRGRWLWLAAFLLLLAAVAAWWWHGYGRDLSAPMAAPAEGVLTDNGPVAVEPLPDSAGSSPVAGDGVTAADAAMLADPELALAQDADFHAWYAAGGPLPVDESQLQPSHPEPVGAVLETADVED